MTRRRRWPRTALEGSKEEPSMDSTLFVEEG
jgi:hypothetical protein